jgi:murein DD-endopeptidase MepM/ murein hydrolase activator NlpD
MNTDTQNPTNPTARGRPIWLLVLIIILGIGGYFFGRIWLESTPPTLELSGVEDGKTYKEEVSLQISTSDRTAGLKSISVQVDENLPQMLGPIRGKGLHTFQFELNTLALNDGEHRLSVVATDKSLRKNTTQRSLRFSIDQTAPKLHVPPQSLSVGQGRTLALFVHADEPVAEISGTIFNKKIVLYLVESNMSYRSFIGVAVTHATQKYPLTLKAADALGNAAEQTFQVEVRESYFERGGYIVLSPEKQKVMLDKSKSREDNAKRGNAYTKANRTEAQLWEGEFIRPTKGARTSTFGKYREYNTGVRRHHYGTDIANAVGTPVYAVNHGVVTLADRLHIYGNAVILNHGQGVSTSYNHLSELRVKQGDRVEKGQLIGLMGATGQVTGPHLHWGMVVNGVAVDPEEWTDEEFVGYSEVK